MNEHQPQELSSDRLLLALFRASAAEAKSLSDEEELDVAIKHEAEMTTISHKRCPPMFRGRARWGSYVGQAWPTPSRSAMRRSSAWPPN